MSASPSRLSVSAAGDTASWINVEEGSQPQAASVAGADTIAEWTIGQPQAASVAGAATLAEWTIEETAETPETREVPKADWVLEGSSTHWKRSSPPATGGTHTRCIGT